MSAYLPVAAQARHALTSASLLAVACQQMHQVALEVACIAFSQHSAKPLTLPTKSELAAHLVTAAHRQCQYQRQTAQGSQCQHQRRTAQGSSHACVTSRCFLTRRMSLANACLWLPLLGLCGGTT